MSKTYDAIVIGAGITGASTACHLRAQGVDNVLLIERHRAGAGGTGKSAAIVRQHYSTPLMTRLAIDSIAMMEEMEAEQQGRFCQSGYMMFVPDALMEKADGNLAMQRSVGVDTHWLDPAGIEEKAPWLNTDDVAGVIYEPRGGYADPLRTTEYFIDKFRNAGGEYREQTACRELIRQGDRITGVVLEEGSVMAGVVVNAAGPWAKPLGELAGLEMQMRIYREQDSIWQARPNRPLPITPISNAVDAIYLRPMGEERFLIGQGFPKDYLEVDPYNYRETAEDTFVELMLERATRRIPSLDGMRLINAYAALYDVTPDWYPFIGPRSGLDGYVDAWGGSGHGFKIGPAVGRNLANWISSGNTTDEFAGLSYDRLAKGELYVGAYGGNRG
ncbi:MAG: FAD-binding oxidoreductase [Rhodospirillales bacterium]